MPVINPAEVWMTDFGMAAKVRPALLLTGAPADDELDLVTVLLHTTALRGNRWELDIPKTISQAGRVPFAASSNSFDDKIGAQARLLNRGRNEARAAGPGRSTGNLNFAQAMRRRELVTSQLPLATKA